MKQLKITFYLIIIDISICNYKSPIIKNKKVNY